MTIAAAYLVSDGLVLGADSTSTFIHNANHGKPVTQFQDHTQKVFEVGQQSRFGLCTWGAGSVGKISHRTVVARLADKVDNEMSTVLNVVDELVNIIEPEAKKRSDAFHLGYFLGGWDPKSHDPACYRLEFTNKETIKKKQPIGNCQFAANTTTFTRTFWGYDPLLYEKLKGELLKKFKPRDKDKFIKKYNDAFDVVADAMRIECFPDPPIREAIDFVYSFLEITLKVEKFRIGQHSCGGQIEIGFITSDRNFRWATHKPFCSAIISQQGAINVK